MIRVRLKILGFTILELTVVIGVVAILLALVLPAIQGAWSAARQSQCQYKLRQLGIAIQQYENVTGFLPPASMSYYRAFFSTYRPAAYYYSAQSRILPYLGYDELYDAINFSALQWASMNGEMPANRTAAQSRISLFLCPSEPSSSLAMAGNSYRCNNGPGPNGSSADDDGDGDMGAFPTRTIVRYSDFTDGLKDTAAMSEKMMGSFGGSFRPRTDIMLLPIEYSSPPIWPTADQWPAFCGRFPDGGEFRTDNGGSWLVLERIYTLYNHTMVPNTRTVDCGRFDTTPRRGLFPARSYHAGCVNVLYMDGSVRAASNSVDLGIWRSLGTRAGGETVSSF